MKPELIDLFPTPLVVEKLTIDDNELKIIMDYDDFYKNGENNFSSYDTFFLNKLPLLTADINRCVQSFVNRILGEQSTLRITQSWINLNPTTTSHHTHSHFNSVLSGIFYIQVNEETGDIHFHRPHLQSRQIMDVITDWNKYNFQTVYFTPKNGDLFLFPSTLMHAVSVNKSPINRISLSFNTFYDGMFGSELNLTKAEFRGENGLLTHPKKGKVAKKK